MASATATWAVAKFAQGLRAVLAIGRRRAAQRRALSRATRSRAPSQSSSPKAADGAVAALPGRCLAARHARALLRRRRGLRRGRACGRPRSRARAPRAAPRTDRARGGSADASGAPSARRGAKLLATASMMRSRNAPGDRLRERAAGRVVDLDAPGFEADGDAARKQTVGRNERGRAARRLGGLAQDQRDDLGLVLGRRRLDEAQALRARSAPCPLRAAAAKACQRSVVPEGRMASATNRRARPDRAPRSAPEQDRDVAARKPEPVEQLLQSELRDARDAPWHRQSGLIASQLASSSARSSAGSTMAPLRQRRHGAHQLDGRRDRAGDAGDDHRAPSAAMAARRRASARMTALRRPAAEMQLRARPDAPASTRSRSSGSRASAASARRMSRAPARRARRGSRPRSRPCP